jgi:hypothetical protein
LMLWSCLSRAEDETMNFINKRKANACFRKWAKIRPARGL